MSRASRQPRSASSSKLDPKRLQQCLSAVARAVIQEHQPLTAAWRTCAREYRLRDIRLDTIKMPLLAALQTEITLFGGPDYGHRLHQSHQTAAAIASLLSDHQIRLVGLPALGLAAEEDLLEVVIFDDEPEALLRLLLDRGVNFQVEQLPWATQAGEREHPRPAVRLATAWLDARVSVLAKRWERLPLYQQGQTVWTQKYEPEAPST